MNPKKRIMEFLNSPKWASVEDNSDDNAAEDRRKVQQIIDGMSLGTAPWLSTMQSAKNI